MNYFDKSVSLRNKASKITMRLQRLWPTVIASIYVFCASTVLCSFTNNLFLVTTL